MVAEVDAVVEGHEESIGIPAIPVSMTRDGDQHRRCHLQFPDNTGPLIPVNKMFGDG